MISYKYAQVFEFYIISATYILNSYNILQERTRRHLTTTLVGKTPRFNFVLPDGYTPVMNDEVIIRVLVSMAHI